MPDHSNQCWSNLLGEGKSVIAPLRCSAYQATAPMKNTRYWSNKLVSSDVMRKNNTFDKILNVIQYEINKMGILRFDDHLRVIYRLAVDFRINPNELLKDFLGELSKAHFPSDKVEFVLNCTGNTLVDEYVVKNSLKECDITYKIKDSSSAQLSIMSQTSYLNFTRNPVYKKYREVMLDDINSTTSVGQQYDLFNQIERAVNFLHFFKIEHGNVSFIGKFLDTHKKQLDVTPIVGKVLGAYVAAFLGKGKGITCQQLYNTISKLSDMGHKFDMNEALILSISKIGKLVEVNDGSPEKTLRKLAADKDLTSLENLGTLLKYYELDINAPSSNGKTALQWAAERGNPKMVEALLIAGTDTKTTDNNGKVPGDIAHDTCSLLLPKSERNDPKF